jgi:hypothetical protein
MNKRGVVMLYVLWVFIAIAIIAVAAVVAPFGAHINTEFYKIGEQMIIDANESVQGIQDASVRATLTSTMDGAQDETQEIIELNTNMFKYSWIFVLVIAGIIIFIIARQYVEYTGGGFV